MAWPLPRECSPSFWHWACALSLLLLLAGCSGLRLYAPDGQPQPMYVVRIYFASLAERDRLASELDVWEVHRPEGYLVARIDGSTYFTLTFTGWHLTPECATMRQLQSALDLSDTMLEQLCPH